MFPDRRARGTARRAHEREERAAGRGVLRNTLLNTAGQAAIGITGALGALLNARALGAEAMGVLGVSFILADFGRPLSSFTHVPSILAAHREHDPDRVFATSLVIKLLLSAAFTGVILLLSPILVQTFRLPPGSVLLASSVVLLGSFYDVGTARLESEQRMVRSNLILAGGSALGLAALAAFWITNTLNVYTSIVATMIANAAMSVLAIVFVGWPFHKGARIDPRLGAQMLKYGVNILAAQLVTQSLLQAETLFVSRFLDNHEAGVYTVVFSLAFVMVTAANAIGAAVLPELSERVSRGEDTARAYHHATLVAMGLGLAIAVVFVVGGPWILSLYGPVYKDGYIPLVILCVFGVFAAATVPAMQMLNAHKQAHLQTRVSLAMLVLNVALSIPLIGRYHLWGAALTTTIVFTLGAFATWTVLWRKEKVLPFGKGAFSAGTSGSSR